MAGFYVQQDWDVKPPSGTPLRRDGHWSVQGLVGCWAFNEGGGVTLFDATDRYNGTIGSRASLKSEGLVFGGTTGIAGNPQVGSVAILGPLTESSIFAFFRTKSTATQISSAGDAIYSERAATGANIYKLALSNTLAPMSVEFTYRNDASVLLQQRVLATTANDGNWHTAAATKRGTAHTVYFDGWSTATGIYGGANSNFTNANMQCLVGGDAADASATWGSPLAGNGAIGLVVRYTRALSAAEIASLSTNPWQVFEPEVRWISVEGAEVIASDIYIIFNLISELI